MLTLLEMYRGCDILSYPALIQEHTFVESTIKTFLVTNSPSDFSSSQVGADEVAAASSSLLVCLLSSLQGGSFLS